MRQTNYIPRYAAGLLRRALAVSPVVVLMGARPTGKSTLVQNETSLSGHLYLTLDDPDVREQARVAPDELLRRAPRLVLDEVQREPDLLLAVKRAVDADRPRANGRFVLTGSANLLLMRRVAESLAGRATYATLRPLSRRERLGRGVPGIWSALLSTPMDKWADLVGEKEDAPADWRKWVKHSGYPVPALELSGPEACSLWFDGYIRTYLERDLQDFPLLHPSSRMQTLLIVGEDHRLGCHPGVDPIALTRAVWCTHFRGVRQGGSTIAMQLVRTLTGNYQRTLGRKLNEIILAVLLTQKIGSKRLPLLYLWCAYYGWRMNNFQAACNQLQLNATQMNLHDEAALVARLKYPQPRNPSNERMATIKWRSRHLIALLQSNHSEYQNIKCLQFPRKQHH